MSKDYQCRLSHTIQDGEHTITIRLRDGEPYRSRQGDNSTVIKRAANADTAALRALRWYLE